MVGACKDQSYYIVAWRGSSGRSGSRWKANMKVLGCEDAKWMKWLRVGTNVRILCTC